jgi:hypothetical protein
MRNGIYEKKERELLTQPSSEQRMNSGENHFGGQLMEEEEIWKRKRIGRGRNLNDGGRGGRDLDDGGSA